MVAISETERNAALTCLMMRVTFGKEGVSEKEAIAFAAKGWIWIGIENDTGWWQVIGARFACPIAREQA